LALNDTMHRRALLALEGEALDRFNAASRDRQLGLFRRLGVQPE